jgi:pilus assembly protein CpaD
MTIEHSHRRRAPAVALLAVLAPGLGGCFTDRVVTGTIYPHDLRERHPIALVDSARNLDLFVVGPEGLDYRQANDLRAYLNEYRRYGGGTIAVQVPVGTERGGATREVVAAIRESAGARLAISGYHPANRTVASPIRLSFQRLQAKVADRCGLWPQDLGVSDAAFNLKNEPYWNYGCSVQANVAAQVADPVDLVRGRPETPPDTARRMQNIAKIRSGADPSTQYQQDGKNKISSSVGN